MVTFSWTLYLSWIVAVARVSTSVRSRDGVGAAAGLHRRNQGAQVMAAARVIAQPTIERGHTQRVVQGAFTS